MQSSSFPKLRWKGEILINLRTQTTKLWCFNTEICFPIVIAATCCLTARYPWSGDTGWKGRAQTSDMLLVWEFLQTVSGYKHGSNLAAKSVLSYRTSEEGTWYLPRSWIVLWGLGREPGTEEYTDSRTGRKGNSGTCGMRYMMRAELTTWLHTSWLEFKERKRLGFCLTTVLMYAFLLNCNHHDA